MPTRKTALLPPHSPQPVPAEYAGAGGTGRRPCVLVAGLGALGIAVVKLLLAADGTSVRLFDPAPVAADDVGELFAPQDIGHARDQVLARRLGAGARPVPEAGTDEAAVASSLAGLLSEVDVIVNCPGTDHRLPREVTAQCRAAGIPLVMARIEAETAVVSSLPSPDGSETISGCPVCAGLHRADRGTLRPERGGVANEDLAAARDLVALALCGVLDMRWDGRTAEAQAIEADFVRRTVTIEPLVRHPRCPSCVPMSTSSIGSVLRDAANWHRTLAQVAPCAPKDLVTLHEALVGLVGKGYGLFSTVTRNSDGGRHAVWKFFRARGVDPTGVALANAHAAAAVRPGFVSGKPAPAITEGLDFEDPRIAEALALMEGLERIFALSHCDPGRIVEARFDRVAADALDPREFLLYTDWQYAQPGFPLQPFDPGQTIRWLGGVDLITGQPVLVPFDFVYDHGGPTALYRANSNGAACHASRPHALVNAIYEVVERDALMVTWLHELALPRVTFSQQDPDPWGLRATLERLDLQFDHVDITVDTGIPVLLGVLRDRRDPGLFLLNMVANLDPGFQVGKLYRELAQFLYPYLVDRTHFVTDRTADPDPDKVTTFADHLAFYQTEERHRLADFLTASPRSSTLPMRTPEAAPDATAELGILLRRLATAGLRVLAVDCTSPMLNSLGLHAVKVLIPGSQQLNAQHRLRALGGERLLRVPERMGLDAPLRPAEDLNPWPHPFW